MDFHSWLIEERGVSDTTARLYMLIARRAMGMLDPADVVKKAQRKSSGRVALAALLAWAAYRGDDKLELRLEELERPTNHLGNATADEVSQIVASLEEVREPYRSAMVILVESGQKLDDMLWLRREDCLVGTQQPVPIVRESGVKFYWKPSKRAVKALKMVCAYGGWEILRDLLGSTYNSAYKRSRRLLKAACREVGIPDLPFSAFRRT